MVDILNNFSNFQSHDFFQDLLEELNDLIFVLDKKSHIVYLNQKPLRNLTGLHKNDLFGENIQKFINPNDRGKFDDFLNQIKSTSKDVLTQVKFKRKGLKDNYVNLQIKGKQIPFGPDEDNIILILKKSLKQKKDLPIQSRYEKRFKSLINNLSEIRFWKLLQPQGKMEMLEELKTMLQLIMDNIPQYIAWKNKELIYLGCNKNFTQLLGLNEPKDIIGKSNYELELHGDLGDKLTEKEKVILENKKPEYHQVEEWSIEPGKKLFLEVNRIPISNRNGEIIGILVSFDDITERKKAEEALNQSQKRYNNLIETINEGFYIQGKNGNLNYVNDRFCEIFEIKRNDLIGKNPIEFLKGKEKNNYVNQFTKLKKKRKKTVEPYELIWTKENGEKLYTITAPQPIYNEENDFNGIFGVITDITEHKIIDLELRKSREKYSHLLNNIPDTVIEFDTKLNYTYAGPQCEKMFGFQPEDLVGTNAMINIHPDDISKTIDVVAEDMRTTGEAIWEFKAKHKDGHYIPVVGKGSLLYKDGEFRVIALLRDITEKKIAERKLKESEEKFRTITEQSLTGIIIIQDDLVKYVNKGMEDILGYSIEEMENNQRLGFLNTVHPKYRDFVREQVRKKQNGENNVLNHYQYECFRKDGKKIWIENYSKTISYEGRNAVLATLIDITEKKKAEEKLKQSEQKFRDLTELLPDIIYEANRNSFITYLNPTGLIKIGLTKEDIGKGVNIFEIIAPEHHKKVKKSIKKILNGEKTEPNEYKLRTKYGTTFYGLIHSRPVVKEHKIIGLRGIVHDITEKRKAEEKIRKSRERFKALFKGFPIPTYIWQKNENDFLLIDFNNAASDITEGAIKDYLGIKASELYAAKPDIIKDLKTCFHNRDSIQKEMKYHYQSTGESRYLLVNYGFVPPNLILVHTQDITEKKRAQQELESLNKQLEEKVRERTKELMESEKKLRKSVKDLRKLDKIKADFITMASHELKTPLISIAGYTEYILMKYNEIDPDIRNDLKVILRNAKRLQNLMDQMLNVLKIDEEKLELSKKHLNIQEIIDHCLEELSYQIKKKNHKIIKKIPEDAKIYADPLRIHHVFTNLVSNSIKFTHEGGKLEISAEKQENAYLFKIKDNGIGLTEKEKGLIFKKFGMIQQTTENYTTEKGTGLGLYITKGIIKTHGGKIWVESEGRGKGSTFLFTIPLNQ